MKTRARHEHWQDAIWRDGIGPRPERHRICHRPAYEVAHHLHRYVIQHDGDDDFTGIEALAQVTDEGGKCGAANKPAHEKCNEPGDAPAREIRCEKYRDHRPCNQLTIATDVE